MTAVLLWQAPSGWILTAWIWASLIGIILAFTDAAVHRLPDRLTFAAAGGALAVLILAAVTSGSTTILTRALLAAVGLAAVYLIPVLAARTGGMGPGDGKLALVIGLCLGALNVTTVITATLAAVLLGGVYVAAMLLTQRLARTDPVPYGPFMLLGALLAIAVHSG